MNILFYRYGSICEPDIIQSLKGLGNNVDEITVEIYNKDFTPSEGVRLLTDTLFAHSYDFIFSINFFTVNITNIKYSALIFIHLFQRYAISSIYDIFAGLWTVRLPSYIRLRSAIHGIAFFCLTEHNIIPFIRIIRTVSFICHLPAIHPAGFLSFKLQHLLTFPVLQVTFPLLAPYTPKNAVFMN